MIFINDEVKKSVLLATITDEIDILDNILIFMLYYADLGTEIAVIGIQCSHTWIA